MATKELIESLRQIVADIKKLQLRHKNCTKSIDCQCESCFDDGLRKEENCVRSVDCQCTARLKERENQVKGTESIVEPVKQDDPSSDGVYLTIKDTESNNCVKIEDGSVDESGEQKMFDKSPQRGEKRMEIDIVPQSLPETQLHLTETDSAYQLCALHLNVNTLSQISKMTTTVIKKGERLEFDSCKKISGNYHILFRAKQSQDILRLLNNPIVASLAFCPQRKNIPSTMSFDPGGITFCMSNSWYMKSIEFIFPSLLSVDSQKLLSRNARIVFDWLSQLNKCIKIEVSRQVPLGVDLESLFYKRRSVEQLTKCKQKYYMCLNGYVSEIPLFVYSTNCATIYYPIDIKIVKEWTGKQFIRVLEAYWRNIQYDVGYILDNFLACSLLEREITVVVELTYGPTDTVQISQMMNSRGFVKYKGSLVALPMEIEGIKSLVQVTKVTVFEDENHFIEVVVDQRVAATRWPGALSFKNSFTLQLERLGMLKKLHEQWYLILLVFILSCKIPAVTLWDNLVLFTTVSAWAVNNVLMYHEQGMEHVYLIFSMLEFVEILNRGDKRPIQKLYWDAFFNFVALDNLVRVILLVSWVMKVAYGEEFKFQLSNFLFNDCSDVCISKNALVRHALLLQATNELGEDVTGFYCYKSLDGGLYVSKYLPRSGGHHMLDLLTVITKKMRGNQLHSFVALCISSHVVKVNNFLEVQLHSVESVVKMQRHDPEIDKRKSQEIQKQVPLLASQISNSLYKIEIWENVLQMTRENAEKLEEEIARLKNDCSKATTKITFYLIDQIENSSLELIHLKYCHWHWCFCGCSNLSPEDATWGILISFESQVPDFDTILEDKDVLKG